MGSIAGSNLQVLFLTSMEHDIQAKISKLYDQQMIWSNCSLFIAEQKSQAYGSMTGSTNDCGLQQRLAQIEKQERYIASMEKTLDMQIKKLQTQLEQVQQRKQAEEKRLQQNIQRGFNYGIGGGR